MTKSEWTLSQAARILKTSQHRLIYLCEKKIILPDHGGAAGRGSSRRFSSRNILEFAVALKLRDLTIPVAPIGAILYVLRAFEKVVGKQISGFSLSRSLCEKDAPELRIIISDGKRLYLSLGQRNKKPKLYGGVNFTRLLMGKLRVTPADLQEVPESSGSLDGPEGTKHVRIEVSVTAIARDLPVEE